MRRMERYARLLEEKEGIVRRINEAKERGDHSEADKLLEENELLMIDDQLEQLEREMSPTYSTFREDCENDNVV
mgnify:CR=1 FL=1